MAVSGLDYLAPVRAMRNFFGRYGTTVGAIRGVFNGIIPVAVVDRYRDDTEGSLFGLSMLSTAAAATYPAFAAGSSTDDWELLAVTLASLFPSWAGNVSAPLYVYTPDSTYVPVETPSPPGFWQPGLNTDWSFTLGSVLGVAGYNTTLPPRLGFAVQSLSNQFNASTSGWGIAQDGAYTFDPPIRVYRDVTLGFIVDRPLFADVPSFSLSILYRIRPRTTDGPRTG